LAADVTPEALAAPETLDPGADVEFDRVDPTTGEVSSVDGTRFDQIAVDPRFQQEQMATLDALQSIADAGGLTAADEAVMNRLRTDTAQADRGRREAILQNMQARGMGGSGNELLAQLQSSQAATDRQAQADMDLAGLAQDRALQAIMQKGGLAGDLRSQAFSEDAARAQAADNIAQFNAGLAQQGSFANAGILNNLALQNAANQFAAGTFNKGNQLDAQKFNIGNTMATNQFNAGQNLQADLANQANQQGVFNQRADIRNNARMYNAQLPQQDFANRVTKATGVQGGLGAQAAQEAEKAARKEKKAGQYGSAIIKGGSTLASGGTR
jgi:hypothetical protein